jgi:hypothetical protein
MNDEPPTTRDVEESTERALASDDRDVETHVHRDAGVRIRTNIQAGSTSERVNVTRLKPYREALGEQVEWAHAKAVEVNE